MKPKKKLYHSCLKLTIVGVALLRGSLCYANLDWERSEIVVSPKSGQKAIDVEFRYKNSGSSEVKFVEIKPDCGCTQVNTTPVGCRPGEQGAMSFRYVFGDNVGSFARNIVVKTNEGEKTLTFRGKIEDWVDVEPRFLVWQSEAIEGVRQVNVTLSDGVEGAVVPTKSSDVHAVVVPITARQFRIDVKPLKGDRTSTTLPIKITRRDLNIETERAVYVIVR
jgi:hypothetical protein